jgi:transmembrane sensor
MKQFNGNMSDELLVKYLLGEASAEEQAEIQQWRDADAANEKHFQHFSLIWDTSKKLEQKSTADENAAWARFKQRTETAGQKSATSVVELTPPGRMNWMRVAAILVLMIGGGWMVSMLWNKNSEMIAMQSGNETLIDTLSDGSIVTLNKNSSIKYPEEFTGDTRLVELQGEAFFEVAPDKKHPFIIHANDADIKVVGTSFNVKSTAAKTEVIVATGIVEVAKNEHTVKLNPKEKATVFLSQDKPLKQSNDDELYNYYRTKEFICNSTPLWRLTDVLSEAYGVNIVIADNRLKNLLLTTTFRDQSLDNILNVISQTFNIKVEKTATEIVLK